MFQNLKSVLTELPKISLVIYGSLGSFSSFFMKPIPIPTRLAAPRYSAPGTPWCRHPPPRSDS